MWSMWDAPSDRDYYDPEGLLEEPDEEDPLDAFSPDDISLDGRHVDLGASGAGTALTKAERARLAYKGGDKREQDIAEATEREMSAALECQIGTAGTLRAFTCACNTGVVGRR